MNIRNYIRSDSFKGVLVGIGIVIVVLLIFQAGVAMGYRKASFANHFGDNYYRAFGERPGMFAVRVRGNSLAEHGAAGKIVSINLPTFVIANEGSVEKVVLVEDDTIIRRFDTSMTLLDLKVDDFTVVLGETNEESQIKAKLIRVLPPPSSI